MFSLENHYHKDPVKMTITRNDGNAIYNNYGYGPTFGGHDIYIANGAGSNTNSYSNLGYTYQVPYGYSYSSNQAKSFLAGGYKFLPSEMEVFYEPRDPGKYIKLVTIMRRKRGRTMVISLI